MYLGRPLKTTGHMPVTPLGGAFVSFLVALVDSRGEPISYAIALYDFDFTSRL